MMEELSRWDAGKTGFALKLKVTISLLYKSLKMDSLQ